MHVSTHRDIEFSRGWADFQNLSTFFLVRTTWADLGGGDARTPSSSQGFDHLYILILKGERTPKKRDFLIKYFKKVSWDARTPSSSQGFDHLYILILKGERTPKKRDFLIKYFKKVS